MLRMLVIKKDHSIIRFRGGSRRVIVHLVFKKNYWFISMGLCRISHSLLPGINSYFERNISFTFQAISLCGDSGFESTMMGVCVQSQAIQSLVDSTLIGALMHVVVALRLSHYSIL